MKYNTKTFYYFFIIVIGIISLFITLRILRSYNISTISGNIKNLLNTYLTQLEKNYTFIKNSNVNNTIFNNLSQYDFPFNIKDIETNYKEFSFEFNENNNTLILYNLNSLNIYEYNNSFFPFLSFFALDRNSSLPLNKTFENIEYNLPVYRQINIYFLINNKESVNDYKNIINEFKKIQNEININNINFIMKFIRYNDKIDIEDNKLFYSSMKKLNSHLLMDELNDYENLNILLLKNDKNNDVITLFNEDINSFIFKINFEKNFNLNTINNILSILKVKPFINRNMYKSSYFNMKIYNNIIKMFSLKNLKFHLYLMASLKNLDKLSKIFSLYESILTYNKVKEKINFIHIVLIDLLKSKFNIDLLYNNILKLYINTQFLMNSNQLVLFEHFFSDEFKIGQFLPIALPILLGLIKSVRAITF